MGLAPQGPSVDSQTSATGSGVQQPHPVALGAAFPPATVNLNSSKRGKLRFVKFCIVRDFDPAEIVHKLRSSCQKGPDNENEGFCQTFACEEPLVQILAPRQPRYGRPIDQEVLQDMLPM
jgi:hypothetical protein